MAVTRDKALRLLNKSEMVLFGDSRNPALRGFSATELARRVDRARTLRDKARDVLQRQKLSSRARTGSKGGALGDANERTRQKGEILEDMLQRFEQRLSAVQAADEPQAKPARSQSASRDETMPAASRRVENRAAKATTVPEDAPPPAKRQRSSAGRALASTHELLADKQRRDQQPKAYQILDAGQVDHDSHPAMASGTATRKALELHAGESRMDAIHGSVSTRDRHNQGKRDSR